MSDEKKSELVALEAFNLKLIAALIRDRGITLRAASVDGMTTEEVQEHLDVVAEKIADSLDKRAGAMLRG